MSLGGKLKAATGELGWGDGLLYMTARVLERGSRGRCRMIKYHFVAQPVATTVLAPPSADAAITVSRAVATDPIVQRFPRPSAVLARRFAAGAVCFVAQTRSGELAGFLWLKQSDYMEDEVRCLYVLEPEGKAVWDFDVWLAPEYRLTRAFARLWDAANAFLRERGCCWSISRISAWNPASLAAHRRLGIERLHSALFLVLGPVQVAMLTCRPYLHLALTQRSHPVLRLRGPDTRTALVAGSAGSSARPSN